MPDEKRRSAAVKGALAGLIGTAALTVAMKVGSTVLPQRDLIPTLPAPARDDPAEQSTGKLADKVAGGVAGGSLDKEGLLLVWLGDCLDLPGPHATPLRPVVD